MPVLRCLFVVFFSSIVLSIQFAISTVIPYIHSPGKKEHWAIYVPQDNTYFYWSLLYTFAVQLVPEQ